MSCAPLGRALLVAVLVALSLAACGRRGPLEAPPDTAATAEQNQAAQTPTEDEEEARSVLPSPTATSRRRSRAIVVPKEPFILDPLL